MLKRIPIPSKPTIALLLTVLASAALLQWGDVPAHASNLRAPVLYEVDLGTQVLTPSAVTVVSLTIPSGTKHAEFYVVSGPVYVRFNGSNPTVAGSFPWPTGHMRKEATDGQKLAGFRAIGDGEIRVIYFGDRRDQ